MFHMNLFYRAMGLLLDRFSQFLYLGCLLRVVGRRLPVPGATACLLELETLLVLHAHYINVLQ